MTMEVRRMVFAIASRRSIQRKSLATVIAAAGFGLFLCGFAASTWLPLALVFLALAGASSSIYMTLNGTIVQELCSDEYRGRVSSVYMVTWGLMPFGALPAGALAEAYGAPLTVFLGGAICLVFALCILAVHPQLRRADAHGTVRAEVVALALPGVATARHAFADARIAPAPLRTLDLHHVIPRRGLSARLVRPPRSAPGRRRQPAAP